MAPAEAGATSALGAIVERLSGESYGAYLQSADTAAVVPMSKCCGTVTEIVTFPADIASR